MNSGKTPPELSLSPVAQARGTLRLPGSKSISNRMLLLAALAEGETQLNALLDADDVRYMREALTQLGVRLEALGEDNWRVYGCGGRFPESKADLFLGNAGTAVRPLTAVLSVLGGDYRIHGVARMHERPIGDLVEALRALHCRVDYIEKTGYPPLRIAPRDVGFSLPPRGGGCPEGAGEGESQNPPLQGGKIPSPSRGGLGWGWVSKDEFSASPSPPTPLQQGEKGVAPFPETVAIRGDVSSQFLSALLMALPLIDGDGTTHTEVVLTTPLISRPYVKITTHLMARFGINVEEPDSQRFRVPRGVRYRSPGTLTVESDASSASYFLAAGVLGGGPVRVTGVGRHSIQGDVAFAEVLHAQGAKITYGDDFIEAQRGAAFKGGEIDCLTIPDAAMTLAITALSAQTPTTLVNIGSWRVKETDRIHAMATELAKLGARVESGDDWLQVYPTECPATTLRHAEIDTYDDHRMAMCFSLVSLLGTAVTIRDPGCVAKTFPGYFEAFEKLLRL
ncbi:MAG: 3-phosphoshikimate 1-carboxyvinyltransferase [Burkholderiales bacterium]|jgi:3-phosphoshikimate 1-carboxyvinyltransferase|nr:3-phosphoshikimate 1-carboxyvinyltransferase [Burkholderiales bacterium]